MYEERGKVRFNRRLTRDTWLMGLKSPIIAKAAIPGHFVMIRVSEGTHPLLRRPFSVCGVERNLILLLYRVVGQGTAMMREAKEGGVMSVLGPLGKGFELPSGKSFPLLVGGGIGVAPLCFLAQRLKKRKVEFMMGFASAADIPTLDHLKGVQTRVSLATDDGTRGHAGFVTDLLDRYLDGKRPDTNAVSLFACGPKLMLIKVAQVALKHHLPCQVSLEASMACGLGACQGCAVKASKTAGRPYHHVCADGPVFEAGAIDWDSL